MKTLFIYFSHTGSGDVVSEYLSKKDIDTRKVEPKKKLPKSFFWSVMTGGFLAGIKYKDKLVNYDNNVQEYERVIIGSPIWNGRFSSPINGVLKQTDLSNKELVFIFYSGSGTAPKAIKRISKEYPHATYIILKEPKKYSEELDKLKNL